MPVNVDYFRTHPLRVAKCQRDIPMSRMLAAEQTGVVADPIHPTAGAFIHYGGVELADRLVMISPSLSEKEWENLAHAWYHSCGVTVKQLLFYLWGIISKELRHGTSSMCDNAFKGSEIHPNAQSLCKEICKSGDWKPKLAKYPDLPIGAYVDAVERHYRKGGWSGAFGGKKWADIALVMKQYLDGTSSAMLAADRAWTLVHNTGPIFNKGFYFKYHDDSLMSVLNAQAKSSVFDLGVDKFLMGTPEYDHPVRTTFYQFVQLAQDAIQKADPDYVLGAGGAVNSDGSKVSASGFGGSDTGKNGAVNFGPFTYATTKERIGE